MSDRVSSNTPGQPILRIKLLPPAVAERIAAGEVIERPASVVKELIENSIDAGATEVSVLLEEGGKGLIEVLDNGHGMAPEDLGLAIQRHATSKLRTLEDLEKIQTLGFRGEALPSVAAVTDLSILSRTPESETAYELRLTSLEAAPEPEPVTFGHFLNSPHGTRIQARGLFSQVPARLKFLKSQSAEVAQVREWIERLALAHPKVGFRLVSDGRSILSLRPQEEADRVRAVLSDGEDYPIITAHNDLGFRERGEGALHVRVHWLQGMSSPQARRVVQVVNGRALRDRMLQQAVLSSFRQALLPGQFPALALYIEIDPAQLDVNVHPTKTEIRFLDSRKVFHAVDKLVESLIAKNGAVGFAASAEMPSSSGQSPGHSFDSSYRRPFISEPPVRFQMPLVASEPVLSVQEPRPDSFLTHRPPSFSGPACETAPAPSANPAVAGLFQSSQYVGTIFNTYLIYDQGSELVLVDQHAAHERIRYERLRTAALNQRGDCVAPSQALLIPEAVRFEPESRALIEERTPWLEALGFEAEIFGDESLLFRAIPTSWGTEELRVRLKNLVERMVAIETSQHQVGIDESLFEKLASEACHSAIRAGDRLEREEAAALIAQLSALEHPWNCPHGRPTITRIPRARFEEWFHRRV